MIVFDVDGTLVGGEQIDWACFDAALEEVAGFKLTEEFFEGIEEVTARAIVHQALSDLAVEERTRMEEAVSETFLMRLEKAHEHDPSCFPATEGAPVLMRELQNRGITVAVATGDWRESIVFKLRAAGLYNEDLTLVTSSDHYSRADIIAAAIDRAGGSLDESVYIGDGLWDYRACQKLGIRFIGVGHRREKLRDAGAKHVLQDLSPAKFWQALASVD